MKDIKTIALELDVSRQTVYNHINNNSKELKGHIIKKSNTTFLDDEGIRIVKESMGLIKVPIIQKDNVSIEQIIESISEQVSATIVEGINQGYNQLESEIKELKEQNELLLKIVNEMNSKKSIFNLFKK